MRTTDGTPPARACCTADLADGAAANVAADNAYAAQVDLGSGQRADQQQVGHKGQVEARCQRRQFRRRQHQQADADGNQGIGQGRFPVRLGQPVRRAVDKDIENEPPQGRIRAEASRDDQRDQRS